MSNDYYKDGDYMFAVGTGRVYRLGKTESQDKAVAPIERSKNRSESFPSYRELLFNANEKYNHTNKQLQIALTNPHFSENDILTIENDLAHLQEYIDYLENKLK